MQIKSWTIIPDNKRGERVLPQQDRLIISQGTAWSLCTLAGQTLSHWEREVIYVWQFHRWPVTNFLVCRPDESKISK